MHASDEFNPRSVFIPDAQAVWRIVNARCSRVQEQRWDGPAPPAVAVQDSGSSILGRIFGCMLETFPKAFARGSFCWQPSKRV